MLIQLLNSGQYLALQRPDTGRNIMSQQSPTLAPQSYRAYFDHLLGCPKCSTPPRRCDDGTALYRTYRADLKKS